MTITADHPTIECVVRTLPPSASGWYRNVWFYGDIVIKCDNGNLMGACAAEYYNYLEFEDFEFERGGETFYVRFPETVMIGEYLIMRKIDFPFLKHADDFGCPDAPIGKTVCNYDEHRDSHRHGILANWIEDELYDRCNISDMHTGNFKFDVYTNTFWIIDFAE